MPIPDYESLMPRVLALSVSEQSIRGAVAKISDDFGLTEEEKRIEIPSGTKTLIKSRIEWAATYLVHAGLLERPRRGHFSITERGRKLLEENPPRLDRHFLKQYPEFVDFLNRHKSTKSAPKLRPTGDETQVTDTSDLTPEEQIGEAYLALENELRIDVLERVLSQSPEFFERLVVKLLSAMGYGSEGTLSKATRPVGDGGIDGVIHQDKLGLDVVYIQAKRNTEKTVGRPELQAFVGSLSGESAHKGVFLTTSKFSSQALDYLRTVPQRVITIDGERLVNLMVEHGVGVRTKQVFELHRVDEDFFIEE